jgi:hypothetical protein
MNDLEKYIRNKYAALILEIEKVGNRYIIEPETGDLLIYSNHISKAEMGPYRYEPSTYKWAAPARVFTNKDMSNFLLKYVNTEIPEVYKKEKKEGWK